MGAHSFDDLLLHVGHKLECVKYAQKGAPPANVAVECVTCHEVLRDFNRPVPATGEKTRSIEMYVGVSSGGGGDTGTWATDYVEIPASTPENKIAEVAETAMRAELEKQKTERLAFVGVYCVPEEEADHDEEEDGE